MSSGMSHIAQSLAYQSCMKRHLILSPYGSVHYVVQSSVVIIKYYLGMISSSASDNVVSRVCKVDYR